MAFFNPFPLGTLPADALRAPLRALSPLDDASFRALLGAVIAAAGAGSGAASAALCALPAAARLGADAPRAVAALQALLLDFAKCNTAADALPSALEERGLAAGKAAVFADAYRAALPALRAALSAAGALWGRRARGAPREARDGAANPRSRPLPSPPLRQSTRRPPAAAARRRFLAPRPARVGQGGGPRRAARLRAPI